MRLQRFAFGGGVSVLTPPRPVVADGEDARLWFAGHAVEVDAVMEEKRRYLREHGSAWPATLSQWEALQAQAAEAMRVFPVVSKALLAAGIPSDPGFFDLDTATLKTTFRLANRLRSRYTVLDFLEGQGRLEEAIDDAFPSPPAAP
jgi:hypothetical protein